jgi:hypothetical protein
MMLSMNWQSIKWCNRGGYPFFDNNIFASDVVRGYDDLTTKLIAVKPSRHTLAIFMSKICMITNQQVNKSMRKNKSALQARHIFSAIGANFYDGLIEPNTTAFTVNKLNRLLAVVKTRHPLFFIGDQKLTNLIGGSHHDQPTKANHPKNLYRYRHHLPAIQGKRFCVPVIP